MTYVYFIRAVDGTGPIKIGSSDKPIRRLFQCNSWSPVPLQILATVNGSLYHERTLHDRFAEHRLHGEWFEPADDLQLLVSRIIDGASLDELGISPSNKIPTAFKSKATRLKQSLSVKLTFAMKRAERLGRFDSRPSDDLLPDNVKAAWRRWSQSADVSLLASEREIIETHIAHLKGVNQ